MFAKSKLIVAGICLFALMGTAHADSWMTSVGADSITIKGKTVRAYDGGRTTSSFTSEKLVEGLLDYLGKESTSPAQAWVATQVYDSMKLMRPNAFRAFSKFTIGLTQLKNNGDGEGPLAWAVNQMLTNKRFNRGATP
ncbi:MAG: hypothetical protein JRH20_31675, partial [Deltaproteobacteria bacterium]|nr:hypothetical protein [Deltaproteobacteria bacterium]